MPQAYLMFNNDLRLLNEQVKILHNGINRIFIHIDAKFSFDLDDPLYKELNSKEKVEFIEDRINVQWGSFRFLEVIMKFFKLLEKYKDIDYVHLLSTQCFPVKSNEFIDDFLIKNKGTEYINYFSVTDKKWERRIKMFHFHEWYNPRSKNAKDLAVKKGATVLRSIQKALFEFGIRRGMPKDFPKKLYGGSAWWSLTYNCTQYVLQYVVENPDVYNRFRFTQLPDELFFQTIIMNSPFAKKVQNNNLRYLKFFPEGSSYAAEIDESDLPFLNADSVLIARKFALNTLHLIEKK